MNEWILWGLVLIAQNASFTWVSRARNSSSLAYHALAATFSNGVYFAALMIGVNKISDARTPATVTGVVLFYTACTVAGSVLMHWVAMRYMERGKRKVGA